MDLTIEFYHWKFFNRILFLSRNETRHVFQLQIIFNTHERKSSISLMEKIFILEWRISIPILSFQFFGGSFGFITKNPKTLFPSPPSSNRFPKTAKDPMNVYFAFNFLGLLRSSFFTSPSFLSLSLSSPIESFHRHANAMALHLAQFHVNFARNTSGTRNTPGDNDMTPAYMTFDGNMWRCLTDARQIVISAHQMHVHGFKDRIKTSRSRGLFVCSFFVG